MMVNDLCIVQRLITTSAHQKGARGSSGQLAVMMWSELWSAFDDDDADDEGELMIARINPRKARHDSDYANQRCDTASQHLSRDQDMDRGDQVS